MADIRPIINARDLIAVLKALPPNMSALVEGPHGVGKSHIARQVAEHFGFPLIDRRLSQMTEGDMIGLPKVSDDVTRFLPVDWFKRGCEEPVVLLLDEINRATLEIMNAAFQIVLDRELNGMRLHPETRIIACVNSGAHYSVNEMDPALINRFALFRFEPDVEDWKVWARKDERIDPLIVEYVHDNPNALREKDLDVMEPMTAYPTPRGWEAVDKCLKHAEIQPSKVFGKQPPDVFYHMVRSIVGQEAAIAFTKFVTEYTRIITAEDVLDNWDEKGNVIVNLSHDAIVSVVDKIGQHCERNQWTQDQVNNLEKFATKCLTGEDWLNLFSYVTKSRNVHNIKLMHKTNITERIMSNVNAAESKL